MLNFSNSFFPLKSGTEVIKDNVLLARFQQTRQDPLGRSSQLKLVLLFQNLIGRRHHFEVCTGLKRDICKIVRPLIWFNNLRSSVMFENSELSVFFIIRTIICVFLYRKNLLVFCWYQLLSEMFVLVDPWISNT